MHSNIYQISKNPIASEDYADPCMFYGDCNNWADYIGSAIKNTGDRQGAIAWLAESLKDIFDRDGETLVYKGMDKFLKDWTDRIKKKANELADGVYDWANFGCIENILNCSHLSIDYRFNIVNWNDYSAGTIADLVDFIQVNKLKEGDRLYIGNIIDFHF